MRKLATGAISFSAAIFAANYILPVGWLIVPAVLMAVTGAALTAMHRKWLRGLVIALIFFSLGLLSYYVKYQLTCARADMLAGETGTVELRLLSYPTSYDSYCRAEARIISDDLPSLKTIVYDNSSSIARLRPGDVVTVTGRFSAADTLYGKPYDNYNSKDIYLKLSSKGKIEYEREKIYLPSIPARLSRYLSERITELFPEDVSAFMQSLMLGDKSRLYADKALTSAMSRSGFMHIVAVSGMHIAFLVGLIRLLFGSSRRSSIFCILMVWGFTLLTGAGAATVRAAFMQTMLLIAPVVYRENDPVTSLSAALAVILLKNPFAAASISLQLSFGAMAGIICFSGRIYGFLGRWIPAKSAFKPLTYIMATAASSIAVMVFVLPLTALHFGYVPLLSVVTNIAGLWAVSLCFCGGWISCMLSFIPALGALAAWLCAWLARYILLVAKLVSGFRYAALYMQTSWAWTWLMLSYLLFAAALALKLKPALKAVLPSVLSLSLLVFVFYNARARYVNGADTFSVIDVGQGQSIAAFSGESTVVIDCGNCFSIDNAGELTGEYLRSCGRERVDLLVLTHLHADHANGVTMLMELVEVKKIMLLDDADDPDEMYAEIKRSAREHGTELLRIDSGCSEKEGGIALKLYKPQLSGTENERCLMVKLSLKDFDALITGDSPARAELELAEGYDLGGIELLVVGHHGSKYSSSEAFLERVGGDYAVISTGYNTYGHPAEETLERLDDCGYNVLRTDKDGTIEIRTG